MGLKGRTPCRAALRAAPVQGTTPHFPSLIATFHPCPFSVRFPYPGCTSRRLTCNLRVHASVDVKSDLFDYARVLRRIARNSMASMIWGSRADSGLVHLPSSMDRGQYDCSSQEGFQLLSRLSGRSHAVRVWTVADLSPTSTASAKDHSTHR